MREHGLNRSVKIIRYKNSRYTVHHATDALMEIVFKNKADLRKLTPEELKLNLKNGQYLFISSTEKMDLFQDAMNFANSSLMRGRGGEPYCVKSRGYRRDGRETHFESSIGRHRYSGPEDFSELRSRFGLKKWNPVPDQLMPFSIRIQ